MEAGEYRLPVPIFDLVDLENLPNSTRIEGGHFHYLKNIVDFDGQKVFFKTFAPDKFTHPVKREHSRAYLEKEHKVMRYLAERGYSYLPAYVDWLDDRDTLVEEAFPVEEDWYWELPEDSIQRDAYIQDIVEALENTPEVDQSFLSLTDHDSLQEYYDLGWKALEDPAKRKLAAKCLREFDSKLHEHVGEGISFMVDVLCDNSERAQLQAMATHQLSIPRPNIAHYDARQSNIAWHPGYGARLVDWSWAAPAPVKSDETMFIIDLFKSGQDVSGLQFEHFDNNHAALLLGFWLGRSSAPTANGNTEVRFHQLASAASAATLLSH